MCGSDLCIKYVSLKAFGKDRKLYAAFIALKAYDGVDRKDLLDFLRIYGVVWKLLKGTRLCYKYANASVCTNG